MSTTMMMSAEGWATDVTRLCERLAERLAREGAPFPGAGAVALAVRGGAGVDRSTFAAQLGLDPHELALAENGALPYEQLPEAIRQLASSESRLDLDRLLGRG
jgi:hypothetical protein